MPLVGVVSRRSVLARATISEHHWKLVVQDTYRKWLVSAAQARGALAVHQQGQGWAIYNDAALQPSGMTGNVMGNAVLAAAHSRDENAWMMRLPPLLFAYEGTIHDADSLCAALNPALVVRGRYPRNPGDLIFMHVATALARAETAVAWDMAMANVARDLHRVRALGSTAFLCSNGVKMFAYAAGRKLLFSNVSDAILMGSSEVLSPGPTTQTLSDGMLLAVAAHPRLASSVLAEPIRNPAPRPRGFDDGGRRPS